MAKNHSRRQFLVMGAGAAALVGVYQERSAAVGMQQQDQIPIKPSTPPGAAPAPTIRRDPSQPGDPSAPTPDPKAVLKANDKDIKQNVAKLASLADDLKKDVDATDSANVLSLGMVHKAEEIEKLARHIASLARG